MAVFTIDKFDTIGTDRLVDATSWEAASDPDFTNIIDHRYFKRATRDDPDIFTWVTPLLDPSGIPYADLDTVFCRMKIHAGDTCSQNWYNVGPANQNDQIVEYRRDGVIYKTANSLEINFR